jgi:hypothetical protein
LPLAPGDAHHLQTLHVPATEEQKEFDGLVQSLTKLLIDSLNEKELIALLVPVARQNLKGSISRLDAALRACGVSGFDPHIAFLRDLQDLRSTGAAHRKGDKYRKVAAKFGVDNKNLRTVFADMLGDAIKCLAFLCTVVVSGALGPSSPATNKP